MRGIYHSSYSDIKRHIRTDIEIYRHKERFIVNKIWRYAGKQICN